MVVSVELWPMDLFCGIVLRSGVAWLLLTCLFPTEGYLIGFVQWEGYLGTFIRARTSVLCVLIWKNELSRPIRTDMAVKNTTIRIYVIYKVLVYVQTSQPTICFGLLQLGHLQVGHKGQRNYTTMQILSLKSGGDEISFTTFDNICIIV